MKISAIILNYNNYQDLKDCLASLKNQELPAGSELKIMIIDNGSHDASTAKIQSEEPGFIYLFNPNNLGFARAANQGFAQLWPETDFFLLVNNDASLAPDCLRQLLAAQKDRPGLSGPAILYKDKPNILWQGGGYFRKLRLNIAMPGKNQELKEKDSRPADFLSGCVLLISRAALAGIGLLDERFFFYGEDLDLCLRARKAGYPITYVPAARAWHNLRSASVDRSNPFVLYNLAYAYFLNTRRHFPKLIGYGFFLFFFLYSPFRLGQIIRGGSGIKSAAAWFQGGIKGLTSKL
jgi:hypothetical protein